MRLHRKVEVVKSDAAAAASATASTSYDSSSLSSSVNLRCPQVTGGITISDDNDLLKVAAHNKDNERRTCRQNVNKPAS